MTVRRKIVHALHVRGLATLCSRDPARVRWTSSRKKVTCEKCLKDLEAGALMFQPGVTA